MRRLHTIRVTSPFGVRKVAQLGRYRLRRCAVDRLEAWSRAYRRHWRVFSIREACDAAGDLVRMVVRARSGTILSEWEITEEPEMKGKCYHCSRSLPLEECGPAEVPAVWVDAEGNAGGAVELICRECLAAGDPEGPGYRGSED